VANRKNSAPARNRTPVVLRHPGLGRIEKNKTKKERDNQEGNILGERILVFVLPHVLE
jgi:hypothetical protein